jgi:hypothetical protein
MRTSSASRFAGLALATLLGVDAHAQPPTCPSADEWPAKIRIEYAVTASRGPFSINGQSVLLFERSGNAYSISVETDSAAIYHSRQASRGTIVKGGLQPVEYVEARGKRTPQTTTFDWETGRVIFSAAPDSPGATEPGLQDRVSLVLQLAWRQRAAAETSFEIPVAGARGVGIYRFARRGVETIKVPVGIVEATRVERAADEENDRLEAWLGTSWCGLPVRIRYTDRKGGVIDHRMRAVTIE